MRELKLVPQNIGKRAINLFYSIHPSSLSLIFIFIVVCRSKLRELKQIGDKMFSRATEYEERPKAIGMLTIVYSISTPRHRPTIVF